MTKIRPLRDRIVIKRITEKKTAGGIVIPDTASDTKPMIGEVLAVGPGKILENGTTLESSLKVGDKVLFGKYAGTEVELLGEQLVVMREDDIMGIIEG